MSTCQRKPPRKIETLTKSLDDIELPIFVEKVVWCDPKHSVIHNLKKKVILADIDKLVRHLYENRVEGRKLNLEAEATLNLC